MPLTIRVSEGRHDDEDFRPSHRRAPRGGIVEAKLLHQQNEQDQAKPDAEQRAETPSAADPVGIVRQPARQSDAVKRRHAGQRHHQQHVAMQPHRRTCGIGDRPNRFPPRRGRRRSAPTERSHRAVTRGLASALVSRSIATSAAGNQKKHMRRAGQTIAACTQNSRHIHTLRAATMPATTACAGKNQLSRERPEMRTMMLATRV